MIISIKGLKFIENLEGFRAVPYKDQAGVSTCGFGHVVRQGESFTKLSRKEAELLLDKDVSKFELDIKSMVKVPLTQTQYDSLISFTYNVGSGAFSDSTLLKCLNKKQYSTAAEEFLKWNKYTDPKTGKLVVSQGLKNRREKERNLFLGGDYGINAFQTLWNTVLFDWS